LIPSVRVILIVAGSGEHPNSLAGQAILNYAASIGADVVFPYAGLSNAQSVEDIINQGEGYTTPAAQLLNLRPPH
jgi:hypothetical protein